MVARRVAFAARYLHQPMSELLGCDVHWLRLLSDEGARIVREENRKGGGD